MQTDNFSTQGGTVTKTADLKGRNQIRASDVRGTDVYNTAGQHLGTVDDIVLSRQSGTALFAIMSFGGFLGINERYHPLPWRTLTYNVEMGGYVVGLTREELEAAPSFEASREPDWNDDQYLGTLGGYYGM